MSRKKLEGMTEQEKINGKKKFNIKDLQPITPLTHAQRQLFDAFHSDREIILATGSAGTGKTFLGMYLGLEAVLSESEYHRLIIIRSCVPSREIGFLPGSQQEKEEVYEEPYMSACQYLFTYKDHKSTYRRLKETGYVEFVSTSFIRGLTFDNAVILVDEIQNLTFEELDTVMTRVGKNSKIIFSGDFAQNDLYRKKGDTSGFPRFVPILQRMGSTYDVVFTKEDIVRSRLVKEYLEAKEELEEGF